LESLTDEQVPEQLAKVRIIRLIVEAESTTVVEEDAKLVGETAAQQIGRGGHLLLHDSVVLLLLGSSLEALPWEGTTEEVHEDVCEWLEIISTGLFYKERSGTVSQREKTKVLTDTQMRVDWRIAGSASQVLVLAIWNVQVGLGITVLLGETEIDNVDLVPTLSDAHQEIIGLDITVDEVAGVDVLHTRDLK
jgi:hypothetical protein